MKNKDIKIIFVDIDWTLLDHKNHCFDHKSIRALNKARRRGYKVFICTARPYHSVKQINIFKYIKVDGCVYASGAMVTVNNKTIYKNVIPLDILYGVCEAVERNNLTMECTLENDRFLIAPEDEYVHSCFASYFEEMPDVRDYHDNEVVSLLLFAPRNVENKLKREMPEGVNFERFHECGVDVYYKKHDKSDGVKKVLEHYGFTKEEAMSIGDDYGDIPMFNNTGISVCMNNGKEDAKKEATFVTKDVWDHGVYHALKQYKII